MPWISCQVASAASRKYIRRVHTRSRLCRHHDGNGRESAVTVVACLRHLLPCLDQEILAGSGPLAHGHGSPPYAQCRLSDYIVSGRVDPSRGVLMLSYGRYPLMESRFTRRSTVKASILFGAAGAAPAFLRTTGTAQTPAVTQNTDVSGELVEWGFGIAETNPMARARVLAFQERSRTSSSKSSSRSTSRSC